MAGPDRKAAVHPKSPQEVARAAPSQIVLRVHLHDLEAGRRPHTFYLVKDGSPFQDVSVSGRGFDAPASVTYTAEDTRSAKATKRLKKKEDLDGLPAEGEERITVEDLTGGFSSAVCETVVPSPRSSGSGGGGGGSDGALGDHFAAHDDDDEGMGRKMVAVLHRLENHVAQTFRVKVRLSREFCALSLEAFVHEMAFKPAGGSSRRMRGWTSSVGAVMEEDEDESSDSEMHE